MTKVTYISIQYLLTTYPGDFNNKSFIKNTCVYGTIYYTWGIVNLRVARGNYRASQFEIDDPCPSLKFDWLRR